MYINLTELVEHLLNPEPGTQFVDVIWPVFNLDEHVLDDYDDATIALTIKMLTPMDIRQTVYSHFHAVAKRLKDLSEALASLSEVGIAAQENYLERIFAWDSELKDNVEIDNPFPENVNSDQLVGWAYYHRKETDRAYEYARVLVELGGTGEMSPLDFQLKVLVPFMAKLNSAAFGGAVRLKEGEPAAEIDLWLMGSDYTPPVSHTLN